MVRRTMDHGFAFLVVVLTSVLHCGCGEKISNRQDAQADCAAVHDPLGVPNGEDVSRWRRAAEQGLDHAQFNLGLCYWFGDSVPKDESEAVKWFRKAAEQNHVEAQVKMGIAYDSGKGVSQDYVEAIKWYRKAAEQGDTDAYCMLGGAYLEGRGVTSVV